MQNVAYNTSEVLVEHRRELREEDHYYFKAIYGYHQNVTEANSLYRTCIREGEKLGLALPDMPHYPDYLKAVANRNETAINPLARVDWQECWFRAYVWNLDLPCQGIKQVA